jgi:spermidine synthase
MNTSGKGSEAHSIYFILYLIITAVICGAQVMVVEVLGSRVIGPFFGVSLFVWTSLITVTLIALAAGYAVGGVLSDRKSTPDYLYGIILLSGLLVLLIPPSKGVVIKACQPLGLRMGSFVSSSILFGPSLFLLGCVSPYIVKVAAKELRNIGRTVGIFYAVSTVGSVLGTMLTGFVLIAYFGVSRIFIFVGVTLIVLSASYFLIFRRKWIFLLSLFLVIPLLIPHAETLKSKTLPNGTMVTEVFSKDSYYGKVKVVDYSFSIFNTRELLIDGPVQGRVDKYTKTAAFSYLYMMHLLPLSINPDGKTCLVIGLGAGVLPMMYKRSGVISDVVDIDPLVVEVAEKYFGFKSSGDIFISDARYFLASSRKKYDYIMLDVFNGDTTPSHVMSLEAFRLMKERLTERGVLTINMAGSLKRDTFITASVIKTLKEVFDTVEIFFTGPLEKAEESSNLAVLAYNFPSVTVDNDVLNDHYVHILVREKVEEAFGKKFKFPSDIEAIVLTDEYNPIEIFDIWQKERHRRNIIKHTDPDILL